MTIHRGKILRGTATSGAKTVILGGAAEPPRGRVLPRGVAEAAEEARTRIERAEQAARAILEDAERAARDVRAEAREEGRREATADLAAAWIALRAEQNARAARDLDGTVELARAMAERILGEAIALDPAKIAMMARQALASASQARHVALRAHPADAEALSKEVSSLGLESAAIEIHADDTRPRGSLLLETDLGTLDADITIQLDRLARSLRDGLRN
jgi:flagellar biosynthesis/type III secretory pathway protein FliH